MIKKLRIKFVCINMLFVFLMLCVIFGLTLSLTHKNMEAENLNLLRSVMPPDKKEEGKQNHGNKSLNEENKIPKQEKPEKTGGKEEKEMGNTHKPTFTLSYDEKGNLVALGSDYYDLSDTAKMEEIYQAALSMNVESAILEDYSLRFLRNNAPDANSFTFTDIRNELTTIRNLIRDCLIIGAIALVAFLLISIALSFWAIKPVERAWVQQRQFIADASHELKTPLTVIMTNAELMLDPNIQEEKREQCASNVLDMSRRMRGLTEEMLTLARADNAREGLMTEICSLPELLEDSLLTFEALFFERGLILNSDVDTGFSVKGNETQLRQLIEILLDNARKYSKEGEVCLSLKKSGGRHCLLTISNPADPIEEEDLKHIFDRFYRIDPARSASNSYGLGLSIAKGIVERHHGSIRADYKDGRIFFEVRLPTM